jgi:glycine cleavage system regulatory protein
MMNQLGAHDMGVTIWAASPRETKPGETTCEAGLTVDDRQRVIEPPPPVF